LHVLPFGLNDPQDPTLESWGGIAKVVSQNVYKSTDKTSIGKWREAYQADFQARLDWAKSGVLSEANHPPVVKVNGTQSSEPLSIEVNAKANVLLDASASSDPDGDKLNFTWKYMADGSNKSVTINGTGAKATVAIPADFKKGDKAHVLVTIKDDGSPALTRYRRIILTWSDKATSTTIATPRQAHALELSIRGSMLQITPATADLCGTISIYTSMGRQLRRLDYVGNGPQSISLEGIPNGFYMASIRSRGHVSSYSFYKAH
jgi:hypothetical protein